MKRIARLLACLLIATAAAVVPGTPAVADTETCVGVGTFNLLDGEMTFTTTETRRFEVFIPSIGRCLDGVAEFLFGTITGTCGAAAGSGFANARPQHDFAVVWAGTELVLLGDTVLGVFTLAPNPFVPSNDCVEGGRSWIGPGALTLHHLPT